MALTRVAASALMALVLLAAGDLDRPRAQGTIACGGFYEVGPGDTLRDIAVTAYGVGNYQLIFNANRQVLARPSLLLVGQRLFVPCLDGSGPRTRSEATGGGGDRDAPLEAEAPAPVSADPQPVGQPVSGREIVPVPLPSRLAEGARGEVADAAPERMPPAGTRVEERSGQPGNPPQRQVRSTEVVPRPPREGDPRRQPRQEAEEPAAPRRVADSASGAQAAAAFQPTASVGDQAGSGTNRDSTETQPSEQTAASTQAERGAIGDSPALPRDDEQARETAERQNAARAAATATEGGRVRPVPAIPRMPQQVFETATLDTSGQTRPNDRMPDASGQAVAEVPETEPETGRQDGVARATGEDEAETKASRAGTGPAEAAARPERVFGLPDGAGPVNTRTPQALAVGPAPVEPLPSSLPIAEAENGEAVDGDELALGAPASEAAPPAPSGTVSQPDGAAAVAPRPIRLLTGDYPPYTGADLPQNGMLADVVVQALRRAAPDRPSRLSFVNDWSLHLSVLLPDGAYDLGLPWFKPDCTRLDDLGGEMRRRCTDFLWSQALHEVVIGYFVRADDPLIEAQDYVALNGKRICRPMGQHTFDLAEKGLAGDAVTLVRAANPGACMEMLVSDEVDVVALSVTVTESLLADRSLAGQVAEIPALADILTLHVIAPRNNPRSRVNLTLINRGLRAMRADGAWFEVIARHLTDYSARIR